MIIFAAIFGLLLVLLRCAQQNLLSGCLLVIGMLVVGAYVLGDSVVSAVHVEHPQHSATNSGPSPTSADREVRSSHPRARHHVRF